MPSLSVSSATHHKPTGKASVRDQPNRSFKDLRKEISTPQQSPRLHCSFCKLSGHELSNCCTAERILSDHTRSQGSSKSSFPPAKFRSAKVGTIQIVKLGESSDDEDSDNGDTSANVWVEIPSETEPSYSLTASVAIDWNFDSGCSSSMTPPDSTLPTTAENHTTIRLADNSKIHSEGSALVPVGIDGLDSIKALVVSKLQEPLLSVAQVCDQGYAVLFTNAGCEVYESGSVEFGRKEMAVGVGYRKGNLYYLSKEMKPFHTSPLHSRRPTLTILSSPIIFDTTISA